jgi:hypothetical protein
MADSSKVLREYLMSIGFVVNTTEQRKFDGAINKTTKLAGLGGAALAGMGVAAVAMVQSFANQMEKLYYASRRTDTTVSQLQAMSFAAGKIGIGGDTMQASIEGMARAMRSSPGLAGVLRGLGIKTEGRSTADKWLDLVHALKSMPFALAERYAAMFGTDADTLFLAEEGEEKLRTNIVLRQQMALEAGVDSDKAAKAAVEYNNIIADTTARFGLLKDALSLALLPAFTEMAKAADQMLLKVTQAISAGHYQKAMEEALTGGQADDEFPKYDWGQFGSYWGDVGSGAMKSVSSIASDAYQKTRKKILGYGHGPGAATQMGRLTESDGLTMAQKKELTEGLEKQYGLWPGVLMSLYQQESSSGLNLSNDSTSALGPFQMVKKTREAYSLDDPLNFSQGADAAAAMLSDLKQASHGDLAGTLTRWHGGGPNSGLHDTAEDRNFAPQVMSRMDVKINIQGSNAHDIAVAVKNKLDDLNGNAVRDLTASAH